MSTLFKFILLLVLARLLYPVFKGIRNALNRPASRRGPKPRGSGSGKKNKENDYSNLSPYEIEDAEFEELKEK